MLLIFQRRNYITATATEELVNELEAVCKMISAFSKTLKD